MARAGESPAVVRGSGPGRPWWSPTQVYPAREAGLDPAKLLTPRSFAGLAEAADRIDVQPFDDGGLAGIGRRHQQAIASFGNSLNCHRQDALDRPGFPGEGQLADDGEIAGPVERDLAFSFRPRRNRLDAEERIRIVAKRTCIGDFIRRRAD